MLAMPLTVPVGKITIERPDISKLNQSFRRFQIGHILRGIIRMSRPPVGEPLLEGSKPPI